MAKAVLDAGLLQWAKRCIIARYFTYQVRLTCMGYMAMAAVAYDDDFPPSQASDVVISFNSEAIYITFFSSRGAKFRSHRYNDLAF